MSDKRFKKRPLSRSNSYTQSTLSGDTPKAWGAKHAAMTLENGMFTDKQKGALITQGDEVLCTKILGSRFELPDEWAFYEDNLLTILKMALYKNEARVVRDAGPHVMPSPELHNAQGHPGLEHIAEGVDARWTQCTSLCGPKSKPEVSQGVSRTAFTHEERKKLTSNETSIEESELQALHGASVACSTVIKLYQKVLAAAELHRRILVFSVSYNQRVVKIFGHFAMIEGDNITYHRHPLFETNLVDDASNRTTPYQIALSIWKHFFPVHLARFRDVLGRQPSRAMESFTARLGLEEDSASGVSTPSSSQENDPSATRLQEENVRLLTVMLKQQDEARQQAVLFERNIEQTERQTERLLAQIQRQSEQYREQMEQQKEEARQRLEQQKEEAYQRSEQQKEEARKEREEIIALLKQSRS
ncbi:hypothetical protein LTR35_017872 [Friedmanniomyces endolithicus]|uniref:DUF7924 domain-containing protein n=1 Tax=Friedmanniomyces endolithicus TaxID=329885 RepID=A0AAN6IZS7_9PEZI|nr:hypothetical protein LTR35_017872 [Friedmanniomyces endolithicus]KAK0267723.1 hypothetical protein LTS00_017743 [Friedmanniomyces endolithicus]KAK0302298.1 hypothetical protein LTR82_017923 [Friedmanniomyces endolithicus]KAK0971864.1 hypothetical protein LTR54_017698 [Friedmanniomyces endolithicus]